MLVQPVERELAAAEAAATTNTKLDDCGEPVPERQPIGAQKEEATNVVERFELDKARTQKARTQASTALSIANHRLIQCKQLSAFAARLQELEGGAPQDLEPAFREFCERAIENEQPCATREGAETDRHRNYPRDLALAFLKGNGTALRPLSFEKPGEAVFDLLSKFEAVYPRVSRNVPEYAVDVADQKFAAEKILSQIHNSLNAIYRNIVNSHLSYMELEDIWAMGASMLAAGEDVAS
eukprot:COSAG05_NODE_1415_length_4942_cov_9.721484_3_plen_239_part_00